MTYANEDSMSTSNLPPLRNLPSWSRVRDLDRGRYPRLLSSDCMVKCPSVNTKSPKASARPCLDEDKRIASLEKDLAFLQEQHKETLERLHAEIEHLKRVNKELQYRIVMEHQHPPKDSRRSNSSGSEGKNSQSTSSEEAAGDGVTSLRITRSPSRHPRTPTRSECEVIIRQLHRANVSQCQELARLKDVLRDAVPNKRKSCAEAGARLGANTRADACQHFPKLPLKPLPRTHQSDGEAVERFLPAIQRNFSSTVSERQRKAQDVHKMRFRRTVNS